MPRLLLFAFIAAWPLASLASSQLILNEAQGFVPLPNCFAGQASISSRIFEYEATAAQGKQIKLKAHAIYPAGYDASARYPAIALFHAGGWQSGSPTQELSQAFYWASRGLVAVAFEYRLFHLYGESPTSIEDATADAKSAIRWLRTYAGQLSVDPQRIIASGDSAGGQMALAAALSDASDESGGPSSAPNAIFAFYPVVDLRLFYGTPSGRADPRSADLALPSVSPIDLLPKRALPPTFIWDGTAETMWLTPPGSTAQFCAASAACAYTAVPRADHGFLAAPGFYQSALAQMDEALIQLGYVKGPQQMARASRACDRMDFGLIAKWDAMYGYPR